MVCCKATSVCTKARRSNCVHSTQSDQMLATGIVGQIGMVHFCGLALAEPRCWFGSIAQPQTSRTLSSQGCTWQQFTLTRGLKVLGTTTSHGPFAQWQFSMLTLHCRYCHSDTV